MIQSDVTYPIDSVEINGVHHFVVDGSHRSRALLDVARYIRIGADDLAKHSYDIAMNAHGCAIRDTLTTLGKGWN